MRKFLVWVACMVYHFVAAQDFNITQVIPPSPTAADLGKAGLAVSNLTTGELATSIPLYTYTCRHLKFPISLSYTGAGLKVDAIASRVGLGWLLNAGGVINRTVMGGADDRTTWIDPPAGFPASHNCATLDYLEKAVFSGYNTQPDLFTFNFMGYSGQFFIDGNGNIQKLEQNNLVITNNNYNSFTVVTPDGVTYIFEAVESSVSVNNCAGNLYDRTAIRNAWFLTQIVHPDGDVIWIKYGNCEFNYQSGVSQSFTSGLSSNSNPTCANAQSFVTCTVTNRNQGVYPVQISSNGGGVIKFWYSDRQDVTGDKCLSKIVIIDTTVDRLILLADGVAGPKVKKAFDLSYVYGNASSTNEMDKRLFLSQLIESPNVLNDEPTKTYSFDYGNINNLPPRLSYSQDYMGYYNGAINQNMITKPDDALQAARLQPYGYANRDPNWTASVRGMLQKIIYPAGGYDSIVYEANNMYKENMPVSPNSTYTYNGIGGDFKQLVESLTSSFDINNDHTAHLVATCNLKEGVTPIDDKYYYINIILEEDGTEIYNQRVDLHTNLQVDFNFKAGKSYQFTVQHFSDVTSLLSLNYYNGPRQHIKEIPGVRVNKIVSVNQFGQPTQKYFFYATLQDLNRPTSLVYNEFPVYETFYTNRELIECSSGEVSCCTQDCNFVRYSSGTFYDLFSYANQHVYYSTVLEADAPDFSNGVTEHNFMVYMDNNYNIISGGTAVNGPLSNTSVGLNGLEYLTRYYRSVGGALQLEKEERKSYKDDTRLRNSKTCYAMIETGSGAFKCASCSETTGGVLDFYNMSCLSYELLSRWVYNDSVITNEYDDVGNLALTTVQVNQYDNAQHLLPTQITTYTSNNSTVSQTTKYPQDVVNADPAHINSAGATNDDWQGLNALVSGNIINVPVETVTVRNNVLAEDVVSLYRINAANGAPHLATVNTSKVNYPFEKRLEVTAYDDKGNILEQKKSNDVPHAYIWDYAKRWPVAEAVNAVQADIAYTSFESDGTGNWTLSGPGLLQGNGVTGTACYQLSLGTISKTNLSGDKTYIVSYWVNNATPLTIAGTQGTPFKGKSINGWTYFENKISGVATVSIPQSQVLIDELRLFPQDAQMTSYTYDPLVGVTTRCDANGKITYYEYDGLGRLHIVRDRDGNIIKTIDYHYMTEPH